ncbi:hypothetical protein F4780DRAFT_779567 [Xylariomycetidae sp. FL0641]|nr:hypothetical protein F4780DRAFT_779567 [Xylariomycetidae sp. FL0641]
MAAANPVPAAPSAQSVGTAGIENADNPHGDFGYFHGPIPNNNAGWVPLNTSEERKEHSRKVIEELGGDAAHYGKQDNPHSKKAADKIYGGRSLDVAC